MALVDDSCSKCGQLSSDGRPHIECPVECEDCGFIRVCDRCPVCYVDRIFEEMTEKEKEIMLWEITNLQPKVKK